MTWAALARYGVDPAPDGLAFVQEFMDTIAAGKPRREDLLADLSTAQEWLDGALSDWAHATAAAPLAVTLEQDDLDRLRDFREDLRHAAAATSAGEQENGGAGAATLPAVPVSMQWDDSGRIQAVPRGSGWRKVASLATVEVFKAQLDGSWCRIKACRNPRCAVAFYDRSRNNSGVWHNVKVCGNAANLRAYRARRRGPGTAT
ncbi:CGNR zinc finger domain-containing protein [Streptomyces sp. NPDC093984]|uniref:CGNR zinc finger domain-containing protein n=1 Tax=Streptomyces sp. NPDC093984 TaxID=3366052 RepID=UPI00382AF52E